MIPQTMTLLFHKRMNYLKFYGEKNKYYQEKVIRLKNKIKKILIKN